METRRATGAIALSELGSFHIGGATRELTGQAPTILNPVPGAPAIALDLNGGYAVGQMYVQYARLAQPRLPCPLLLWHGGGMTGACWESTPDGRAGWQSFFLRAGLDVYVCDAVERGRAGFARWPEFYPGPPLFMPQHAAWENYRVGPVAGFSAQPAHRRPFEPGQFPIEAFDAFARQLVPRWPGNEALIQAAYDALLHRVGKCVLLAHSQGAGFALRAALAAPDRIAALVLVEPGGTSGIAPDAFAAACRFPVLCVWGDHVEQVAFWRAARHAAHALLEAIEQRGGDAMTLDLPSRGIRGNSHLLMMDRNSDVVADSVLEWIDAKSIVL